MKFDIRQQNIGTSLQGESLQQERILRKKCRTLSIKSTKFQQLFE